MNQKQYFIALICILVLGGGAFATFLTVHQAKTNAQHSALQTRRKEASAQTSEITKWTVDSVKEKHDAIDKRLKQTGFSGSVLVVSHGKVILSKGYYFSTIRDRRNNSPLTAYYIGSITKSITAVAFMQLRERGFIHFNDPVSQFIPHFPNGRRITMIDLLCHVSGIGDTTETAKFMTRNELVNRIALHSLHPASKPGTVWHYSDSNYALLAAILDQLTQEHLHQTLHAYIRQYIFQQAGMLRSGFGEQMDQAVSPSSGYIIEGANAFQERIPSFSQLLGCGDVYTTVWDLYLFDHALAHDQLLSKAATREIFSRHFSDVSYSCGWYLNRKGWGRDTYTSHGVLGGWNGSNAISANKQNYIVLLSNEKRSEVVFRKLNQFIIQTLDQ
ncbi:beta-lactamase family protein [Sporolactobacillus shoreicorticis]|uniref:Serine hydrolase domain-containing protein n=1 Tax=Sporolactobacillus shoreicorticis TaxID=1923877 RepID=A0ABW5S159_9BACL|nr:serine hydrolase domain-containing protein [Sporolactobacillus shoreicorticis]MCO7124549.1 beta-lactamase family protein [Sporolactobacillus shoreicorticis]